MATDKLINHDSGPPVSAHWTNLVTDPGGMTSITAASALGGTANGLEIDFSIANTIDLRETYVALPATNQFRFRYRFDPNTVGTQAGTKIVARVNIETAAFDIIARIHISVTAAGQWQVLAGATADSGPSPNSGNINISNAVHCVEMAYQRSSGAGIADGSWTFYIDGSSVHTETNLVLFAHYGNVAFIRYTMPFLPNPGGIFYLDEILIDDSASTSLCALNLQLAPMTKPVDIDADGSNLYLALLGNSNPVLIKMSTALDADGTTVFEPGAGDDIGVQCGRFDADVVWVAGAFDGTNVVEKSEDGGTIFTVKDPATFGDVEAFVVGPDSDDRVLIADDNINIQQTLDDGVTWAAINSGTGFNVNAIARLPQNVQESVFGNDSGATDNIDYSPNSGADMEDFSTGFPTENVTRVIVN